MNKMPMAEKVEVASQFRTDVPLSGNTLGTLDFGILRPVHFWDLMPDTIFKGDFSVFTRLLPLQMPVLGSAKVVTKLYWCPYRLSWPLFEAKLNNRKSIRIGSYQYTPHLPSVKNDEVVRIFLSSVGEDDTSDSTHLLYPITYVPVDSSTAFDIQISEADRVSLSLDGLYYRFTPKGKEFYSWLLGLGYSFNWNLADQTEMSALPVVSYARVFYDHILSDKRQDLTYFEQFFNPVSTSSSNFVSRLLPLFEAVRYAFFDFDYFTSAWTSVDGVDVNQIGNLSYRNPVTGSNFGPRSADLENWPVNDINPTLYQGNPDTDEFVSLNPHDMQFMSDLWKYIRSSNLVGTSAANQVLMKFGIKPQYFNDVITHQIAFGESPIQISDVMSTAESDNVPVGAYSGKGLSYTDGHKFKLETGADYGCVIAISTILPVTRYYQGRKRYLFHRDTFDFFQPQFDNMVGQPIRNDELYADLVHGNEFADGKDNGLQPNGVFGFVPRYTEYKIGNDFLLGDFRVNSESNDFAPLQLYRKIPQPSTATPLENVLNFSRIGRNERIFYDRIFYWQSDEAEHFIVNYSFGVSASIPAQSISESQLPEEHTDKDKTVKVVVGSKNM